MLVDDHLYDNERKAFKIFLVSIIGIILILFSGVFLGFSIRNSTLVNDIVFSCSRSISEQIVLPRRWSAEFGGVYVKKGPGVESNPWLDHPDLEAVDGTMLTLRNPAIMTRELSELADTQAGYRFRITSLKPKNPANEPDDFERRSLTAFETGLTELWETEINKSGNEFRYMGALRTEASCLQCHSDQGYKEGDIRGGISVSYKITDMEQNLRKNTMSTLLVTLVLSILTGCIVYVFISRLRRELERTRKDLSRAATEDALTGLYNRRFTMQRFSQEVEKAIRTKADMACAILDVDDFKSVNDLFGHQSGDMVLKESASAMLECTRSYDIVSRYGGEEFLILFPGVDSSAALQACDRIRSSVAQKTNAALGGKRIVTVSIGISDLGSVLIKSSIPIDVLLDKEDKSDGGTGLIERLLKEADDALYQAKGSGKNRCVIHGASL